MFLYLYNNEANVLIWCIIISPCVQYMVVLVVFIICYSDDFYDGSVPQWKFDINKVGGGIVMDGAIHWIRPLRLL